MDTPTKFLLPRERGSKQDIYYTLEQCLPEICRHVTVCHTACYGPFHYLLQRFALSVAIEKVLFTG